MASTDWLNHDARYRNLGLTVPVTFCLNAQNWRDLYAPGLSAGSSPTLSAKIQAALGGEGAEQKFSALVNGIPDSAILWHLRSAISQLEVKLGMPMGITVVKSLPIDEGLVQGRDYDIAAPRLPYTHGETTTWFRIDLPPGVIEINRVRGYYFNTPVWEFSNDKGNLDLIRLEWARQGIAHIIPTDLQSIIVTNAGQGGGGGNYGIWHTINLHHSPIPDFWAVDYVRGPTTRDGQAGHIEAVLADWIFLHASRPLLSIDGLKTSKGLSSASLSIDGISRSVGLQASAIYGLNSALEHMYKELEDSIDWKSLRAYKRGLRLKMYSY